MNVLRQTEFLWPRHLLVSAAAAALIAGGSFFIAPETQAQPAPGSNGSPALPHVDAPADGMVNGPPSRDTYPQALREQQTEDIETDPETGSAALPEVDAPDTGVVDKPEDIGRSERALGPPEEDTDTLDSEPDTGASPALPHVDEPDTGIVESPQN